MSLLRFALLFLAVFSGSVILINPSYASDDEPVDVTDQLMVNGSLRFLGVRANVDSQGSLTLELPNGIDIPAPLIEQLPVGTRISFVPERSTVHFAQPVKSVWKMVQTEMARLEAGPLLAKK